MEPANSSIQLPEAVVISIKKMIDDMDSLSSARCIYRVPTIIRKVNEEAYTPRVVSIGPLHRDGEGLAALEQQKLQYLQTFLTRANLKMEECVQRLTDEEEKVRRCYAEKVELSPKEFVEMVLLDGCFMLEFLLRKYDGKYIEGDDLVYGKPHMFALVSTDVLLLENQLPLFVLSDIYDLIPCSRHKTFPSLHDLVYTFVSSVVDMDWPDSNSSPTALHLVDCLRNCYLAETPILGPEDKTMSSFSPSATRLHEAGVKFDIVESESLLDLQFDNGVLKIPILEIHDYTETILRNQIAFEQCHHEVRPILDYATLIDSIIDTPADVNLLMEKGIIKSIVGSSESICELFNNLGKQAVLGDKPCFFQLCEDLRGHCDIHWNRWKAILKSQYFHTPWAVISLSAGIILLILTVTQTVCSMLQL